VTLADFERMQQSVLFGDEDVKCLRRSHDVLKDEVEAVLDVWYGFVVDTARSTTRRGSTTSTRSGSATTGRGRTAPTARRRRPSCRSATCSC
jgi:phosphodiesterase/alkaline phosphatase D-like protein